MWLGPCTIMALNLNHLFAIIVHEIGNSKQLHSRFADSCVVAEMQTRRRKNSELLHLRLGKPKSTGAARRMRTRIGGGTASQRHSQPCAVAPRHCSACDRRCAPALSVVAFRDGWLDVGLSRICASSDVGGGKLPAAAAASAATIFRDGETRSGALHSC